MSNNFIPTGPQDFGNHHKLMRMAENIVNRVSAILPFQIPFIKIYGGARSEPVYNQGRLMETWTAIFEFELPDHPADVSFHIAGFDQNDLSPDDHIKAMHDASVYVTNLLKQAMNNEL